MSRVEQVRGFLEARDNEVEVLGSDFVVARQPGLGGRTDATCVWVLSPEALRGRQREIVEEDLENRFRSATREHRGARLYLLVETREGLSASFVRDCSRNHGVRIVVPVQFFDMSFRYDQAPNAATAIGTLAGSAEEYEKERIPQPFTVEGTEISGDDLVAFLDERIARHATENDPHVWFITAPAGQGKSVTFSSLFLQLYKQFQSRKRHHELYPRPLPMLPAHIREAAGHNLKGLIDAFLQADVAGHATRAQFDWMLDQGFLIWMLDGLDEVITRDEDFYAYIEDRITFPESKPRIVISVRDSLFRSSDSLREFADYYQSVVDVIRLEPWGSREKRMFAWIKRMKTLPGAKSSDPIQVRELLNLLEAPPVAARLSSLPFYAGIIAESEAADVADEVGLLDLAVDQLCLREYEKGLLDRRVLPLEALREWLEELAVEAYRGGGVSAEELRELAELLPALAVGDLTEEQQRELQDQILMAPFLSRSQMTGRVDFAHEILGEFLAARRLVHEFGQNPARLLHGASIRRWAPGSIMFPTMARGLKGHEEDLVRLLVEELPTEDAFRNVLQLLAAFEDGGEFVRRSLEDRSGIRLDGVQFRNLTLDGIHLHSSDLTNADFSGSTMIGAQLDGAILKNTRLPSGSNGELRRAEFGDLENFVSIIPGEGRAIEDHQEVAKWLDRVTGEVRTRQAPCGAALQIRHMFHKFVHTHGEGRRDSLPRRAVLRGTQFRNAPDVRRCLKQTLEFEYLCENRTPRGQRIERPRNVRYGEIVAFVRDGTLSSGLRSLLDSLCSEKGCQHRTGTGTR